MTGPTEALRDGARPDRSAVGERETAGDERRILVFAPVGRTAGLARSAIEDAGLACTVCDSMDGFCREIRRGAGAAVLIEEAIATEADVRQLAAALDAQPIWSDLPLHVFVSDDRETRPRYALLRRIAADRGMAILTRPIDMRTFVEPLRGALRYRMRQYALRDALHDLWTVKKRAAAESRQKGRLLATMSHELRTPLAAVIGYAELLASGTSGPVSETQRTQIERIQRSAQHVTALIEEVLAFARLEAGKASVDAVVFDGRETVREAAEMIEPSAVAQGLAFEVDIPDEPVRLETDAGKLRQILLNLLSNAVKFTDTGGVHLRMRCADGDRVVFSVSDTGIGIDSDQRERIFEPFEQGGRAGAHRGKGTGLGLGVSREYARLLGGAIMVESEVGEGSTFTLDIPRAPPVESSGAAPRSDRRGAPRESSTRDLP